MCDSSYVLDCLKYDENIFKTSEMFARSDEQRILKEKLNFKWYDKLKTATPVYVFAYQEKGWNV